MNRLIKICVTALLTNSTQITIRGVSLNETTGYLHQKTSGADEPAIAHKNDGPNNQEPPDTFKIDAKDTAYPLKDSADFLKDDNRQMGATPITSFDNDDPSSFGTQYDHAARSNVEAGAQKGKPTQSELGKNEQNQGATGPCLCSLNELKQSLAPLIR